MSEESWNRLTRAGVGWSITAFAAGRTLTFVATLILARLLVPADFGVVAAILVYLALLELVSDLGMKATVVYEQERDYSGRLDTAFTINLGIAAVLTAVGVLAAAPVAGFFGIPGEAGLFRLAALSLLLTGLGNIHDAVLLRRLAFRRRMIPDLARGISRGLTSIVLALAGLGAAALVIGTLAGQAVWSATQWAITRFRPRLRIDWRVARSMAGYGTGAAALEIFGVLAQRADAVVIGKVLGPSALGIYTVAFRVPELLVSSTAWSVSKVTFPALSRARAAGPAGPGEAEGDVVRPMLAVVRWQALAALPAATLIAIASTPMIVVLFGSEWAAGAGVMAAIALMTGFDAVTMPLGDALKATAQQRLLVAINLALVPLSIAAMIALAPAGIVAVAWVATVGSAIHLAIVSVVCRRALGLALSGLAAVLRPALLGSLGCALGAGATRLMLPGHGIGELAAILGAGLATGLVALALLAPATATQIWNLLRALRPRRTEAPAQPGSRAALPEAAPAAPRRLARAERLVRGGGGLLPSIPVWAWFALGGNGAWTWLAGLGVLAALAGLMALRLPRAGLADAPALALAALAGLCVLALLSAAWATDRGAALLEAERAALFAVSFALPLLWPPSLRFLGGTIAGLAALAVVAASLALSADLDPDGRLTGPLDYPNAIAALLAGAGLALSTLWGADDRRGHRALAWAGGAWLIGVAILAQSRGMMLVLPLTAALVLVLAPRRLRLLLAFGAIAAALLLVAPLLLDVRDAALDPGRASALGPALAALSLAAAALAGLAAATSPRGTEAPGDAANPAPTAGRRRGLAVLAAVGAVVSLSLVPPATGWIEARWDDFRQPDYVRVGAADNRFEAGLGSNRADYWRVSAEAAGERPLQGVGAGNFAAEYRRAGDSAATPEHAHSIWFSALGELGLPGLGLLACFVIAGSLAVRARLRAAATRERAIRVAAVVPALYLVLHGSGDWIADFPLLTAPALALLAAAIAAPSIGSPVRAPRDPAPAWVMAIAALVVAVSTVPLAAADRIAEVGWRDALRDPGEGLGKLHLAAALNPLSAEAPTAIGTVCALEGRSGCARAGFAEAASRDPSAWFVQLELGLLARERGRAAEAGARLRLARSLAPRDPLANGDAASSRDAARRLLARREAFSPTAGTTSADRSRPLRYDEGPSDGPR